MSQPLVSSYFATRKRRTSEELRNKSKVLILHDNDQINTLEVFPEERVEKVTQAPTKTQTKKDLVSRNLQFDLSSKQSRPKRVPRSRKTSIDESQPGIIETLQKAKEKEENNRVVFEKLGSLSPKKSVQKQSAKQTKKTELKLESINENVVEPAYMKTPTKSQPVCMKTPTKSSPAFLRTPTKLSPAKNISIDEVKKKLSANPRLAELRSRIDKFKNLENRLENLEDLHKQNRVELKKNQERIKIKEFDRIEIEIPVSPMKSPAKFLSPNRFLSPTKTLTLSPKASPARRALFEPKELPATPVTASPTKTPAYQRYQSLSDTDSLRLPYHYRLLLTTFTSIDTVSAMLYNRNEVITFSKLKPAVQELSRRDFNLNLLAQIKTIYPECFSIYQQKLRSYASNEREKYELVLTPVIEVDSKKSGRNTPDEENVLKSAKETLMSPSILLERKKIFHKKILDIVREEHEKFLLSLEPPVVISKEKVTRWHPDFDVETCRDIEKAELPQPPIEKPSQSAKEILEMAQDAFTARMKKAMEKLAENKAKSSRTDLLKTPEAARNINSSIVDTPPATPTTQINTPHRSELKGIPMALLEKIRAKQAAKALKMMTRSKEESKDLLMHSRLPEMARIIRNIFVSEKKSVLLLETVLKKLDDSYRIKLSFAELEDHIRLICKHLPLWAKIHEVRKMNYLKLAKDLEMTKVISKLEKMANEKL